ncbi:hypothetical protein [Chryseobacterium sp.]|uniref:hypothetical protein n=1 Tax=Chryseobacterium sp. TaxID=1871047 RepID=UPI001AFDB079|nr:hypothetical protein [Chryseobacterium sp.]MBO9694476.1 hypothetical protein [Chryseobacterium sp.]
MLLILSFIFALLSCTCTYFISKKENRKRKIIFAFISPFVALYTFYIVGIISLSIVSENKKVDIGVGDAWYVPLKNDYQLLFIDVPEQAGINKENGVTVISEVEKIEENATQIFGKTAGNRYFLLDTKTDDLKIFDTDKELSALHAGKKLNLVETTEFYSKRKNDIMAYWSLLIVFFSLMISAVAVYIWKLILIF